MDDQVAVQMMKRCKQEIDDQRRQIAMLAPKADAYDNLAAVIRLAAPRRSEGYSEDLSWTLQKAIDDLMKPKPETVVDSAG